MKTNSFQNNPSTHSAYMSKIYIITIFFFISTIKLFGQYDYIIDPGTINLTLSKKNDFSVMALKSRIEKTILIGYSPLNNTSIKIGYFNSVDNTSWVKTRGNIYSISIGTYYLINTSNIKNDDGFLLYLNTGYSSGEITNNWRNALDGFRNAFTEFKHQKYFIDSGVRFKWKFFASNLNFKQTGIQFTNGNIIGQIYAPTRGTLDELENRETFYTFEMNITIEVTIKHGGIVLGFPVYFRNEDKMISNTIPRENYIGLFLNIGKFFN